MRTVRSLLLLTFAILFSVLVFLTIATYVTSRRWERDMSQTLQDHGIRTRVTINAIERKVILRSPVWSITTQERAPVRLIKADSLVLTIPLRELPALLLAPETLDVPVLPATVERLIIRGAPPVPELYITTADLRLYGRFSLDPATWRPDRFLGEIQRLEADLDRGSLPEAQVFERARLFAERTELPDTSHLESPLFSGTVSGTVHDGRVIPPAGIISWLESRRSGILSVLPSEGIAFTRLDFLVTAQEDKLRLDRGAIEGPRLGALARGEIHRDRTTGGFGGYRGEFTVTRISPDLRAAAAVFVYILAGDTIPPGTDAFSLEVDGESAARRAGRPSFKLAP